MNILVFPTTCPVCQSENFSDTSMTNNNGIYGPGYRSETVLALVCCDGCGLVFKPKYEYKPDDYSNPFDF